jgi:hypothetical protein
MINSTEELFEAVGVNNNTLSEKDRSFLDNNGYLIIPPHEAVLNSIDVLRDKIDFLIKHEGHKGGWEGFEEFYKEGKDFDPGSRRLGNLLNKDFLFSEMLKIPELLAGVHHVIQDEIKLAGYNMREPNMGEGYQDIHIDWFPRDNKDEPFDSAAAMIYLDDSTVENGAVRVIEGSHKELGWPDDKIDVTKPHKDEIQAEIKAGSILILNLNLWHSGTVNKSNKRRRVLFITFRKRSFPQYINQQDYISDDMKNSFDDALKYLIALRDSDENQGVKRVTRGDLYREKFGHKEQKRK